MSLIRVPLSDLGEHSSASTWIYNSHGAERCRSLAWFVPRLRSSAGNWIPPMQTSGLVSPSAAHSTGERDPLNLERTETPPGGLAAVVYSFSEPPRTSSWGTTQPLVAES